MSNSDRSDDPSWIGRTLGAYRIVSLLAAGGMGEVYRAVRADGLYPQAVAIKLIRRELIGEVMLSRFRAEREILAALQHPNIARILDAGVTDAGLPYIVMEMIEGEPIDRYCDAHGSSLRERLALFVTVCAAVQFAHQHLTVHRDLKPGNVFVAQDGAVKLLDFGVAKVLDPGASAPVLTSLRAMTPEYSSPEQIRGEPITTATDIYSLGVILYRLLTGRSPYRAANTDPYALAREVCDVDVLKPSLNMSREMTFSGKQLVGDLDSIVLKALSKERNKRYESAQQFAADVQRHLDNQTVSARPRTWTYSAGRFVARNRAVSLAVALLFLVIVASTLATLRQARIAAAERDRAQRNFEGVRQLANSLMFDIHDEIAKLPGSIKARQLLVDKALAYLDPLAREVRDDPALQVELAEAYMRVGRVQGQIGYNNLGDHAAAQRSYEQAITLLQRSLGDDAASKKESLTLARAYNLASSNLDALGRPSEELEMISMEIDLMQKRLALLPDSIEVLAKVGAGFYRRSQFRGGHSDSAGAIADGERAVEIYEKIVAKAPNYKNRDNLAFVYSNMAEHLLKTNDSASRANGIESLRKALATMREITDKQQDNVEGQRHLAVAASELGKALGSTGHPDEGLPYMEQSLPIFRRLYEADKTNRLARLDLVETEENEGNLLAGLGDAVNAVDHCRSAVELLGALPNPPESDLELSAALVEAQTDLANAYWSAAEGAAPPRRAGFSRDARLAATAALQTAQHIVAKKPEVAGDYAAFIAKDEELLARQ